MPFVDYDVKELCDIACLIARKKGLEIDWAAQQKLVSVFETVQDQKDFGNGRYVRNVIEKAKMAQASRLLAKDYDEITRKEVTTLCADDFEIPVQKRQLNKPRIGFIA